MEPSTSHDRSERFAHLLNPIRDLSENWKIDIAGDLTNYLDELDTITITVGAGGVEKTVDFVEAALLIQGATSVYSKKVDYLYQLVLQVLDLLNNRKNQKGKEKAGAHKDRAQENDIDEDSDFENLDDIKVSDNVDLKEDFSQPYEYQGKHLMRPMPMSLIPLDENEKRDIPLLNKREEVIGKMDDFKINTAYLHPSGTLLLDPADAHLVEEATMSEGAEILYHGMENMESPVPGGEAPYVGPEEHEGSSCGDAPGFDSDMENERDAAPMQEGTLVNGGEGEGVRGSVSLLRAGQRRAPSQRSVVVELQAVVEKPMSKQNITSWDVRDQYQSGNVGGKPLKCGKSFKIQARKRAYGGIQKEGTRGKGAQQPGFWGSDFINDQYFSHRKQFPKNRRKTPIWEAFDGVFWTELKRRRKDAKKRWPTVSVPDSEDDTEEETEREEDGKREEIVEDAESVEDNHLSDMGGLEEEDFDVFPPQHDDIPEPQPREIQPETSAEERPPSSLSYEELVQWHLDRYHKAAQNYAVTTDLSKRVQDWENKIAPTLRKEENRRKFAIHDYGSEILENFKEIGEEMEFREIVKEKPKWEACRYFLSSLMLANTYNVEIKDKQVNEATEKMDSWTIKLLSTERHHEQFT